MVHKSKSLSEPRTLAWITRTSATQRLAFAGAVVLPLGLVLMIGRPVVEAALTGCCVMVTINLLLAWRCIARADPSATQTSIARFDQSSAATLATVIVSVVISMVAIGLVLATSKALPLPLRISHIALAIAMIANVG
jgi:uncharacterized membrane protein